MDEKIPLPYTLSSYRFWNERERKTRLAEKYGLTFPFKSEQWSQITGPVCPLCENRNSWVEQSDGNRYYCVCELTRKLDATEFEYESPLQPKKFAELRLHRPNSDCKDPEYAKAIRQGTEDLGYLKKDIAQWITQPGCWMLIQGNPGNGKTHILSVIKNSLPSLAMYVSAEDLARKLFQGLDDHTVGEIVHELSTAPILLLDDFGAGTLGGFVIDQLHTIINYRYMSSKFNYPVIMTTNHSINQMASSNDVKISRLISRMIDTEISNVYRLSQPDYRNAKFQMNTKVVK